MTAELGTVASEPTMLPLTESQKALLVVDGLVPTREIYNQVGRFDIDPAIPVQTVAEAILTLVTVQPAMRQTFGQLPELHARLTPPPTLDDPAPAPTHAPPVPDDDVV